MKKKCVLERRKIEKQNKTENTIFIRNESRRLNIYAVGVVQSRESEL